MCCVDDLLTCSAQNRFSSEPVQLRTRNKLKMGGERKVVIVMFCCNSSVRRFFDHLKADQVNNQQSSGVVYYWNDHIIILRVFFVMLAFLWKRKAGAKTCALRINWLWTVARASLSYFPTRAHLNHWVRLRSCSSKVVRNGRFFYLNHKMQSWIYATLKVIYVKMKATDRTWLYYLLTLLSFALNWL